jgi:hypothetical protein
MISNITSVETIPSSIRQRFAPLAGLIETRIVSSKQSKVKFRQAGIAIGDSQPKENAQPLSAPDRVLHLLAVLC